MTLRRLFHIPAAASQATMTALEMTGARYEVTLVPMHKGGLADPAFRALNPAGQVPTLQLGDEVLVETTAILFTLARLYPAAGILPPGDALGDARAIARLAFCASSLHPLLTRIVAPSRICDVSPDAEARTRELGLMALAQRLGVVEGWLDAGDWVLGNAFTAADAYVAWFTARAPLAGVDLDAYPRVADHLARVRTEPVVKRVLAREAEYMATLEADGATFPPIQRKLIMG